MNAYPLRRTARQSFRQIAPPLYMYNATTVLYSYKSLVDLKVSCHSVQMMSDDESLSAIVSVVVETNPGTQFS